MQQVHQDYLRVGTDILISNNFWTSPTRMEPVGLKDEWEDYARAAASIALEARNRMNPDAFVFGGMAPPDLQRLSKEPDVKLFGKDEYRKEYLDHAKVLADIGIDALLPTSTSDSSRTASPQWMPARKQVFLCLSVSGIYRTTERCSTAKLSRISRRPSRAILSRESCLCVRSRRTWDPA